jgi:hypothetical protein
MYSLNAARTAWCRLIEIRLKWMRAESWESAGMADGFSMKSIYYIILTTFKYLLINNGVLGFWGDRKSVV